MARAVVAYRVLVVGLVVVLAAGAGAQVAQHLRIETSPEYFAANDPVVQETLSAYRKDFGRDDVYLVLVEGDVFSSDFLTRLQGLHAAVAAMQLELTPVEVAETPAVAGQGAPAGFADAEGEGWGDEDEGWGGEDEGWGDEDVVAQGVFAEVTSLVNARTVSVDGEGTLTVKGRLDDWSPDQDLTAWKASVLADPQLVGQLVAVDGSHAVIAAKSPVVTDEDSRALDAALTELVAPFAAPGFAPTVTGMAGLERAVSSSILADMRKLNGTALLVMALVLWLLFRRALWVVGPLAVVVVSVVSTLGAMATVGTPVTLITNIVPAFLICVGLGDAVHVQNVVRDLRDQGVPGDRAIRDAVASTGMPIVYTSLTTMVGLLSFRVASTQGVSEMGTAAAFGVAVAMTLSLTLLPAILSWQGDEAVAASAGPRTPDRIDAVVDALTAASRHPAGRRWVLLGGAAVAVAALASLTLVRVYHNPMTWLPDDHPTVVGLQTYDREVGGSANLVVVVDAPNGLGVRDVAVVQGLQTVAEAARAFTHPVTGQHPVSATTSVADVVAETHSALHGGPRAVPAGQRAVSDALLLFETSAPDQLGSLITTDDARAHLTVRVDWMDAGSFLPLAEAMDAAIAEAFPPGVTARATGTVYTLVTTVGALIGDLLRSFGVALVVIAGMMWVLLREGRLAVLALVPNVLPVAVVLAVMGWTGVPIDLATLLIASIVLGIAVDDTIHYLHQFRTAYAASGDVEEALHHAVQHAGRAMVATSGVLALGFSVYLLSSMTNIQRFGMLVALACVVALVSDLLLVPALIRVSYPARATNHAES